ncbi:MAG: site-specific integrase [Actinobacteria bacterium]|nr:site-specific integrase [Actinomycetota bacterium]
MRGSVGSYDTKRGRRWQVVYDLPPGADGRRRQAKRRGFATRRDAQAELRKALAAADEGRHVDHSPQTLADYLRAWLAGVAVKPTTLENYRTCAEAYAIPRLGGVKLQALTAEHIDALYRDLERSGRRDGGPLAPKSVRHVHTMLRRALQVAVERGHVVRNVADLAHPPSRTATRSKAARDKAWPAEQVRTFLAHVQGDRLYALWYLIATTGLRRGEALGLRWSDLDLDGGRLRVAQTVTVADKRPVWSTDGKTGSAERTIALDTSTVAVLRGHRKGQLAERLAEGLSARPDRGLVFCWEDGRPIHPDRASTWFLRHCRALGLPEIGVHGLRHSYATAALRAGVSPHVVSKRLGHASVAITLDVYAHVFVGDDESAAEVAAAAILGVS